MNKYGYVFCHYILNNIFTHGYDTIYTGAYPLYKRSLYIYYVTLYYTPYTTL